MSATDMVLRGVQGQLYATFYSDGTATDTDDDVATVVVYDANEEVFDSGSVDHVGAGTFNYTLAPQDDLMRYRLVWSGVFGGVTQTIETSAEVVGGFLFSINAIRNRPPLKKLANVDKYPTAVIADVREEVTDFFARYCRISFVPRYGRATIDGSGRSGLYLPNRGILRIYRGTSGGGAIDPALLHVYDDGYLVSESGWSSERRGVVLEYEHGFAAPPARISRAAMVYAESLLVGTDLTDRATTFSDETGTYRLSMPDSMRDRPTGIPFVDTVLNEYSETLVVV